MILTNERLESLKSSRIRGKKSCARAAGKAANFTFTVALGTHLEHQTEDVEGRRKLEEAQKECPK